jgi:tetratricopeptide (TPR) repeat protein
MADLITELRDRRILPAVGVYVAGVWVAIEILDRLVERYLLSPYLTDIVFWGLYSLIPAVMLIAWTHGRPGKDKATRLEKVGVPINLIATIGLLITVFGDKDFDLTATQITVNNELGQQETHYITSETFRRRMAVFFWNNESGNPELDWLQYGITELLVQDLQQDAFVLARSPWDNYGDGFYSRMRRGGFNDGLNIPLTLMRKIANEANHQYFIDGSLNIDNDEYVLTARIWDTQTLNQVAKIERRGWDIYTTTDLISKDIREALEVPESSKRIAEDLPLTETYGESEGALKAYIYGLNARLFDNDFEASSKYFDEATTIDPGFVLGWFLKASNKIEGGDLPGAQEALAKAQELDYRLPARDRAQLKAILYRLAGENEKLISFLRLQTKIRDDASSHNRLAMMLMLSGKLEEAKKESLIALERDALNVGIYLQLSRLERASGNMEAAIDYARKYQEQKPEDIEANIQLGDLLRDSGNLNASEEHYKQAQLLQNSPVRPTLKLAVIASRKGDIPAARQYLSEAEGFAQTPMQKSQVNEGNALLEFRLGKVREAISQTFEQEQYMLKSQGLFEVTLSIYVPLIEYYVLLGDFKAAHAALEKATGQLTPPADKFMAFSAAVIHARENDIVAAEAALEQARAVMEQFQLAYLGAQVQLVEAIISEVKGDYKAVAAHSIKTIEQLKETAIGNSVQFGLPQIYAQIARAHTRLGELDKAEDSIENGFLLDPSEPWLWVEKARLQQARNMPQLALASVNYALAIWKDADEEFVMLKRARKLAAEIQSQ